MKFFHKHLTNRIESNPSINEISEKLYQLGHEHDILKQTYDIDFTPNRGDCLSLNGLLRDLRPFFNIKKDEPIYEKELILPI